MRYISIACFLLCQFLALPAAQAQTPPPLPSPASAGANDPIAGPIRKSDTVRVLVSGADTLSGDFRVDGDGTILLPRLGQITVENKSLSEAARDIAGRIETKKLLKRADVAVYILARKAHEVVINGAVNTQGRQTIKDNTVLSEVVEAAVPQPASDLGRVILSRDSRDTIINYRKYRNGESGLGEFNPVLQDGDRIYVYSATPAEGSVRVNGEVKDTSKILLPITTGNTVGQVLQIVGGVTDYADRNNIFISRGGKRIPVAYDAILRNVPGADTPLQDKDEINVPRLDKPKQVTVAGAVQSPKPYPLLTRVTLLEAIALAGGPQDGAQQNKVELRRRNESGGLTTKVLNLQKDADASAVLQNGDYIFVPYARRRQNVDILSIIGVLSGIAVIASQIRR